MTPVAELVVGQTVRFRRGGYWQTGEVTYIGRYIAHIKAGDDFLGFRTYTENLTILKSSQREETDNGNQ